MATPDSSKMTWEWLYSTEWSKLLGLASTLTPLHQAEDIVQSALVRAISSPQLTPSRGMLYRLVRIEATDLSRRELARRRRESEWIQIHSTDHLPMEFDAKTSTTARLPYGGLKPVGEGKGHVLAKVMCPTCGNPFKPRKSPNKSGRQTACSAECARKLRYA